MLGKPPKRKGFLFSFNERDWNHYIGQLFRGDADWDKKPVCTRRRSQVLPLGFWFTVRPYGPFRVVAPYAIVETRNFARPVVRNEDSGTITPFLADDLAAFVRIKPAKHRGICNVSGDP